MISLDDSKLIQNREDNWVDLGMIEVFEYIPLDEYAQA